MKCLLAVILTATTITVGAVVLNKTQSCGLIGWDGECISWNYPVKGNTTLKVETNTGMQNIDHYNIQPAGVR